MRKYWIIFRNAAERELRNPALLIARLGFLAALVLVTEKLWLAIGHRGFDPVNIVWYLSVNEVPLFCHDNHIQRMITNDVRSGNIGYSLLRPFSYFSQCVADGMGAYCARLPFVLLGSIILAWTLSGGLPSTVQGVVVIPLLLLLSGVFINFCLVTIGIMGLYMQSTNPIYMIWQRCLFLLGSLFYPLTIFPPLFQRIARHTPFSHVMYGTARLVYEFDWVLVRSTVCHLFLWTLFAFLLMKWMLSILLKKVSVNGG